MTEPRHRAWLGARRLVAASLVALTLATTSVAQAQSPERVIELERRGDLLGAMAALEPLLAMASRPDDRLVVLLMRANLEEQLGRYRSLEGTTERLLEGLRGPSFVRAQALCYRSSYLAWVGDAEGAAAALDEAESMASGDPRLLIQIQRRRGEVALSQGDFELAWRACSFMAARHFRDVDPRDRERLRTMSCWGEALLLSDTPRTAGSVLADAVAQSQEELGHEHPDTAKHALALASFYARTGATKRAERLHQTSMGLLEKSLGANSRFAVQARTRFAAVVAGAGDRDAAKALLAQARTAAASLGPNDPDHAVVLESMAALATASGNDAEARDLLHEAVTIRSGAPAANDAVAAGLTLAQLAERQQALGETEAAIATLRDALDRVDEASASLLATGSAQQKAKNAARLRGLTDQVVALHLQHAPANGDAAALAARSVLRHKARVLEALTARVAQRTDPTPEERQVLAELAQVRALLSSRVLGRIRRGEDRSVSDQGFLEGMGYFELRELEAKLPTRALPKPVTVAEVAAALPPGSVLVEIVAYRPPNLKARHGEARHAPARYAAYVLHRDGRLHAVDLGVAAAIDERVQAFREALVAEADVAALARELDGLIMQPIRPLLEGTPVLFLAPDGQLSLVPYAALRDENGHYLLESMAFTFLTSGRELVRMAERRPSRSGSLVVAAPIYGAGPGASGESDGSRGLFDLTRMYFPPLDETRPEAERVAELLGDAELVLGADATESKLKTARGPRVLHVSTHGYFLADDRRSLRPGSRSLELVTVTQPTEPQGPKLELDDPLLRAGLAFSGANAISQALMGSADDGLLTAMEAASLDLDGTKLVVLSACQTGVGEVANGEGVFGLRRAFAIAGAETQVMSLWKVDDLATRQLMEEMFSRLQQGVGRSEALRQAQLKMRDQHPFLWAAFFAAGDPSSLDGKPAAPQLDTKMPTYDPPAGNLPPGSGSSCGCELAPTRSEPALWLLALPLTLLVRRRRS